MGYGLQVWVQNRSLSIDGLAVAIGCSRFWVELLGDLVLSFGRDMALVLYDEYLVFKQRITDDGKVSVCNTCQPMFKLLSRD